MRTLLEGIADVGMKVVPALAGGAAAPVLAIATSVVALAKVAEQTFGPDVAGPQLVETREQIEQAIRDHVADTSAKLRGA